MDFKKMVNKHKDEIIKFRRDLHRIPELAFQEKKTSAYIADVLQTRGLTVQTGIARTGVMGVMVLPSPGKTSLIRSDMDALPISEATGLPFTSIHDGIMHACGHDAHMAMVLGAAMVLSECRNELKGNIKFVFQPAEESPGGARPMIEAGVLENPHVDYSLGCHVWPAISEGTIGVKAGPLMAANGDFDIRIIGSEGHGAMPHQCVDALEVGTGVVNALHQVVSRQIDPLKPAVVTVGCFNAGRAANIIPGEAFISGTTRTFDIVLWDSWQERIDKILKGVCHSRNAGYELNYEKGYPPLVNDKFMAQVVKKCASDAFGKNQVIEPEPTMGAEDMAYFLQKTKGCFFFLGTGYSGGAPIHNAKFDLNENVLLAGVELYCRVAFDLHN